MLSQWRCTTDDWTGKAARLGLLIHKPLLSLGPAFSNDLAGTMIRSSS